LGKYSKKVKLYNDELTDIYTSSNIIWVIRLRRMRWVEHVACMGERRGACRVLLAKPDEREHLEYPAIDVRIILR
jgi:hypothetical protein